MIAVIVIAVILIIGAYYTGVQHGKTTATKTMASGYAGGMRGAGGTRGAGVVNGSVLSVDGTTMTIQGRDGSSKIVLYSGSTQFMKTTAGTSTDVVVGSQVMVAGKTNSDGSITASTISLRPNMPAGGMGTMPQ